MLIAGSATGWDGFRSDAVAQRGGDRLVIREDFAAAERSLLFSACDIVVHPSRDESFGLIAVEAWAARRPVVLADIPCIRTFVDAGRTAEMIAPGDDVALAETIIELLGDPARRDRMAAAGRAEVEARFDWEHVCDAWDEALRRLVDEDR